MKIFVAHKGLPLVNFDPSHNGPDDIVAVSRQFPDMQFVVFHGAWDKSHVEGPYDPNARIGIDTFLRALDVHGVPPNSNVWVDLGTVWREVLRDPTTAAHTLGKLLKRTGAHRVLWGTDAIWYGSPQAQIQAFRAFTISNEFQDRFGYPALTETVKASSRLLARVQNEASRSRITRAPGFTSVVVWTARTREPIILPVMPDVSRASNLRYRPPHSERELDLRLAEAARRVSVQADCTVDEALGLMRERARLTCHTVDEVAEAVCRHAIWFLLARRANGPA